MLIYYTELCCLLFERCLDAAIVRRLQTLKCGCQLVLWFLAYRFSMAAVELRMPDLFGCDQCKRTEDEKWHCLNHKAHNPKISCCKAATIVSCETNSRPTSVEAARVSAFHIVKPQKPQLSPFPFENDWQCAVRDMQRKPGRFLRGHVTSKLFIWTVCPQSAADGTKWAVKMEHGAVIFGIQMQRESRFSSTSSASVFHLSHLHISVECSRCSSEGVVYTSGRNLYSAMTSTAHKIFKNKNSLKSSAHLWAVQRLNFYGSTSCCFFSVDGGQMERLQSGCEEKKCHRGLRICCWCMQLAGMHYSMIECSEEDLPDSHRRMDCHHELSQLAVSLERCQMHSLIRKGKAFIWGFSNNGLT